MRPEKEEVVEEKSRLIEFPSREKAKVVLVRATHTKLRPTIYSTNFTSDEAFPGNPVFGKSWGEERGEYLLTRALENVRKRIKTPQPFNLPFHFERISPTKKCITQFQAL